MTAQSRLLAGRYRLDQPLGRGGMGTVWRAHDERLGRDVAVKVLEPRAAADPSAAERFEREARTLATIGHPGVVVVHDFGVDNPPYGSAFLVMELLPGPSLAEIIAARGPLPVAEAVRYAAETAEALAAAHAAGIIHRDVKPGNLVLDDAGSVRLVDFGIARGGAGESTLTLTGTVLGSAAYLAPELASGDQATPQADLYALGCSLVALLTGRPPFGGDSPVAIVGQHISEPPPDLQRLRPEVPHELARIVDQLLTKDPASRPAEAVEVAHRLRALDQSPVGAGAPLSTAQSLPVGEQTSVLPTSIGLTAGSPGGRRRRRRRNAPRRTLPMFAVGGVLILLLVLGFSLAGDGDDPDSSATLSPAATPASSTPFPTAATPSPSPTVTPTPVKPTEVTTLRSALADLQRRLDAMETGPTRKIVRDLARRVRDITEKINDEDYEGAGEKLREFRSRVAELADNDRISGTEAERLRQAARVVSDLLPDD